MAQSIRNKAKLLSLALFSVTTACADASRIGDRLRIGDTVGDELPTGFSPACGSQWSNVIRIHIPKNPQFVKRDVKLFKSQSETFPGEEDDSPSGGIDLTSSKHDLTKDNFSFAVRSSSSDPIENRQSIDLSKPFLVRFIDDSGILGTNPHVAINPQTQNAIACEVGSHVKKDGKTGVVRLWIYSPKPSNNSVLDFVVYGTTADGTINVAIDPHVFNEG